MISQRQLQKIKLLAAILLFTGVLFAITAPSLYSGENGFILYTLSGGFTGTPSYYTHYNYIVHPLISFPIHLLYKWLPSVSWYPLFLLAVSIVSIYHIVVTSINEKLRGGVNWLVLLALFFVFFRVFILQLEFSYTAILCTIAGFCELTKIHTGNSQKKIKITALFFLLLAFALRPHMLIPIMGIALPFFFYTNKKSKRSTALTLGIAAVFGIIAVFSQKMSFLSLDPTWQKEENYRSTIYNIYNTHNADTSVLSETQKNKLELVWSGLLIDNNYLSEQDLQDIHNASKNAKKMVAPPRQELYWLFVNNRIYIAALLFFVLYLIFAKINVRLILISFVLFSGGTILLLLTAKIPNYLLPAGFCFLTVVACRTLFENKHSYTRRETIALTIGCGFLLIFSSFRIIDDRKIQQDRMNRFISFQKITTQNPDKLFIISDNNIIQGMNAFAPIASFPLKNYIDSEFFINNTAVSVLRKFGLSDISQIPFRNDILFVGRPPEALVRYFRTKYNIVVNIELVPPTSQSLSVFRLRA